MDFERIQVHGSRCVFCTQASSEFWQISGERHPSSSGSELANRGMPQANKRHHELIQRLISQ
jgi:hypothetical protein